MSVGTDKTLGGKPIRDRIGHVVCKKTLFYQDSGKTFLTAKFEKLYYTEILEDWTQGGAKLEEQECCSHFNH